MITALLNVTQPTISYRVRELEGQLGVQLIIRHGRSLNLTSDGEVLRGYAERMMGLVQGIEANIMAHGSGVRTLRMGVTDSFAALCLPALLTELDTTFPTTRVTGYSGEGLLDTCSIANVFEGPNLASCTEAIRLANPFWRVG